MTRVITWAGVALAGAAAVAIGALLLIPLAVDLDPYRAALEKALTQASGRPARVSGDLRLSGGGLGGSPLGLSSLLPDGQIGSACR